MKWLVIERGGGGLLKKDDCSSAIAQASQEMGPINLYDIYVDVCLGSQQDDHHFDNGGISLARR